MGMRQRGFYSRAAPATPRAGSIFPPVLQPFSIFGTAFRVITGPDGPNNVDLAVKIVDGRPFNGRHWVFVGSLTNVEFTLTVTDTSTGAVRTYHNAPGEQASLADTDAFP
jgi:hypothetical protein